MFIHKMIGRFLAKGLPNDEFKGAKYLRIIAGSKEYIITRGRGPKDFDFPSLPVREVKFVCDAWDPKLRVRGYGHHMVGENVREVVVTL